MTRVLENRAWDFSHRNLSRPRTRPGLRIVDGELVFDGLRVNSSEAFDHAQPIADNPVETPNQRLVVEIGGLDDERIAVPAAARVPQPLTDTWPDVRATVHRYDSHFVDVFLETSHILRRLHDLVVVVVNSRNCWYSAVDDAALTEAQNHL